MLKYIQQCFSDTRGVYGVMWKKVIEPDRPRMSIQHGACPWHAG
jgi:hypothetical protein